MSKPTSKPGWTSTTNPSSEPTSKKLIGWSAGEKPSAEHMNWLFKTISEWINHVDVDRVKGETGDAGPQGIDGNVGPVGPAGQSGGGGAKGITGDQGPVGDQGPQGAAGAVAGFDSTQNARVTTLESKARISAATTVSAGVPYSGQATAEITSASSSIDWSLSPSQKLNLSGNATISFANGVSGEVYFLSIQQPSGGSATVSWPGSVSWNGGSVPTLSTAGNTKDVFGFYFDGSGYVGYAINSLKGFRVPQSGSETKSGYIAGGVSLSNSMSDVQKLNFNSEILSTVQSYFGSVLDANGVYGNTRLNFDYFGQGTQSATHGYRSFGLYIATTGILPTVDNQNSSVTTKLTFANDTGSLINIRPTNVSPNNGWHTAASTGRKAVIQSSNYSYMHQASNALAKMTFASDTFSNVTTTNFAVSPTNYSSFGLSTDTIGTIWGSASSLITGYKISFANETGAVSTAAYTNSNITTSGAGGEAIDGETKGYWQKQTAVSAASCYGCNKSTEMWNTIANALNYGATATATQGLAAGYFCGGDNLTSTPVYFRSATSQVKKVAFSPETYQVSSATLTNAKHLAAGFEG